MSEDLFYGLSPKSLNSSILDIISRDQRPLPIRSKVFAAVAALQKFDALPELLDQQSLSNRIVAGDTELYRGISGASGLPGVAYAKALAAGQMYPGTQVAFGQGIYFATPSEIISSPFAIFPKWSATAHKHSRKSQELPGMIVRAALKQTAKLGESTSIRQLLAENKARARAIFKNLGPVDQGTFAAMLGYESLKCEDYQECEGETTILVFNRGCLCLQNLGLPVSVNNVT